MSRLLIHRRGEAGCPRRERRWERRPRGQDRARSGAGAARRGSNTHLCRERGSHGATAAESTPRWPRRTARQAPSRQAPAGARGPSAGRGLLAAPVVSQNLSFQPSFHRKRNEGDCLERKQETLARDEGWMCRPSCRRGSSTDFFQTHCTSDRFADARLAVVRNAPASEDTEIKTTFLLVSLSPGACLSSPF